MTRKPVYAGLFYPEDPEKLLSMIDKYIENAGEPQLSDVNGIVAPHAGYPYSGPVAGYAYRELKGVGAPVVVVLAPSHRVPFNGAAILDSGLYESPLGALEIDEEICGDLLESATFNVMEDVHRGEHSLEVQVPFIQRVMPGARLVPVIIGTVNPGICRTIADEIFEALEKSGEKAVVVVSTDLSHYHTQDKAVEIDSRFLETFKHFDEKELSSLLRSGGAEACGEAPLITSFPLMRNLGSERVEVLNYGTSGDTSGDLSQVVGYFSAVFV